MKDWLKNLKLNESRIGFGLGVAVMVLAGLLLANYFRSINNLPASERVSSTATEVSPTPQPGVEAESPAPVAGTVYEIQKGDSLWKISMKTYGTGYSWNKIYEANKEILGQNPSLINVGTKITLPGAGAGQVEYTVSSGDNLWNISVKICGDGFQWEQIASANSLTKPRLIYPGSVLNVRCK